MHTRRFVVSILTTLFAVPASAQVTTLVSQNSSGVIGNSASYYVTLSDDGRYAVFSSNASNLVPGDSNSKVDFFLRDRLTGAVDNVHVSSAGVQANDSNDGYWPSVSPDGRYVVYGSAATNLVPNDTNGFVDVFLRDRQTGTTELISVNSAGEQGDGDSHPGGVSADGRYVMFWSYASNFYPFDSNDADVFVRDRVSGTTELISKTLSGPPAGNSGGLSMSSDGRYVAFESDAIDLVAGDTNGTWDIFVRDRSSATTERISVSTSGAQANGASHYARMSTDGRYVVFESEATNLVAGDTNAAIDIFLRDRQTGTTERVSVNGAGGQGNDESDRATVSADGRFVAFRSAASNLVANDTWQYNDVFVRDRVAGTTEMIDVSTASVQAASGADDPSISADGRFVAFPSFSSNLVPNDTNNQYDVYLHDRSASGFTSLCDAGVGGVIACPCANPPSGPGKGCDNSSATGGAVITASGAAYLSGDTLVFTATGEKPTALSIFSQGSTLLTNGVTFGMGVRCASTNLKRLYTKSAVGGAASAPSGSDLSVHARSAALGDTITPGSSRYYYVYYRDPSVLGGCPSSSTFNTTQTGRVSWSP
jgi:hypothetical protein